MDEEKIFNLSAMQLFVVPVTKKLLTTPNRAMDEEIPFAVKNFISVLPIMFETGLEDLFNGKFGNLQYLDKANIDPTAISYELSEKVRQAFDAYIFLSYRKKDRKYAQELMRLIHKYDFCRDIAIWYDEFLVPVDKDTMREKYDQIPECVNAYDESGLSDALLEKFKNLAIHGNEDPEHNFFIGLAYLAGIDVEKDYDTAILWQERFVAIKEATYQKAEERDEDHEKVETLTCNLALAEALFSLAVYCMESEKTEDAEKAVHRAMGVSFSMQSDWFNALHNFARGFYMMAKVLRKIGQFYDALGDTENARAYYEKEFESVNRLLAAKGSLMIDQWLSLIVCTARLGKLNLDQGNFDASEKYYLQYNNAAKQALALRQTARDYRNLANSHFSLAALYEKMNADPADITENYEEAADMIMNALELEEEEVLLKALGGSEDPRDMAMFAEACWNTAYARYRQGKEDGEDLMRQAYETYIDFDERCPSFGFFAERKEEIEKEFPFLAT